MLRIRLCTIIFALSLLSSRAFAHTDLPLLHTQNIDDLTTRLIQAKSNEERTNLLDVNKDLVTPQLRKRLTAQAVRAVFTGDYETGLNINNLIQLVGERNKDKAWIAVATINSAAVYFLQGKLLNARGAYARVPKIEEISNEKDKDAAAHVLGLRGFIAFFLRSYEQGLKDCRESLKLRDSNEDKLDIGFTFSAMGMILSEQGNYQEASEYLQRSLKIFNEIDDKMWRALPLNSLGTLYRMENKYELSIRYYEESLELIRQFNINILLHYALYGLGESYQSLGELEKALEFFRQSFALRQQLTDKAATARALKNIGNIYRQFGDYAQALSYLRQSLQLYEELRSKNLAAARLHDIGVVYSYQNNFAMALEYFERSIKLAEEVNDQETLWNSYSDLGWLHGKLQNHTQSLQYFQKSLVAAEAEGNKRRTILAHETIALAYAWLGEYEKSEPHLQKAMALNREIPNLLYLAEILRYSGQLHFLRKDYNKAIENYLQGLQFAAGANDKRWSLWLLLALVYTCDAKGDHQKAVEYAERVTLLARQQNDPEVLAETLRLSGKAYRAINQPEKARQAFAAAIQIVETMRTQVAGDELERQRFFESRISPYHEMVALLLAQNKSTEALIYAERAKARSLLEVLQNGKFDITKTLTGDEQIQERKLNGEILALNSQRLRELQSIKPDQERLEAIKSRLYKARLNYEDFQTRLYVAHPQLKIQRGDAEPFKTEEAAALLPDTKTLLLEYIVTDDKTYLLAISRSETKNVISIKSFTLPMMGKDLTEKISRFRHQLAERDFDFTTTAKELYTSMKLKSESSVIKANLTLLGTSPTRLDSFSLSFRHQTASSIIFSTSQYRAMLLHDQSSMRTSYCP